MAKRLANLPYALGEPLPSGGYAESFETTHRSARAVLKLARVQPIAGARTTRPAFASVGLAFQTGLAADWQPDPNAVVGAEARLLQRLDHPAFPRFLADGTAELDGHKRHYLVREFIPGRTWREALRTATPPTLKDFRQLVGHLSEAQRRGVLSFHGDVKPDNLVLTPDQGVRILDPSSGLAERGDLGDVRLFTTVEYNPLLASSDVPALGMLLLEMLGTQHPLHPIDMQGAGRDISLALNDWLRARAAAGCGRATARLSWIVLPSDGGPIDRDLETIGLRCLELTLRKDGVLDKAEPFTSVQELAKALS